MDEFAADVTIYVRGRFKIKNTIICGKSPKGGRGQGQNETAIGEIYAIFGTYMAYI